MSICGDCVETHSLVTRLSQQVRIERAAVEGIEKLDPEGMEDLSIIRTPSINWKINQSIPVRRLENSPAPAVSCCLR